MDVEEEEEGFSFKLSWSARIRTSLRRPLCITYDHALVTVAASASMSAFLAIHPGSNSDKTPFSASAQSIPNTPQASSCVFALFIACFISVRRFAVAACAVRQYLVFE